MPALEAGPRRLLGAATKLLLIVLLAGGLVALMHAAAPAGAAGGSGPVSAAVGFAPSPAPILVDGLVPPVGEELRGNDYGFDWQHSVQVVANLRAEPPTVPVVLLLGGSSARECTVSDASWTSQIQKRGGYTVQTYDLGSKHRTYAQDLAFVQKLPRKMSAIVYIGINLGRFCLPATSASITLPAPAPIGSYNQHVYSNTRYIESWSEKKYYVWYWKKARYPEFKACFGTQMKVLQQIIVTCQAKGFHVALLDLPRDLPVIGHAFDAPVTKYHQACSNLCQRYHIPWVHYVAACHFVDTDFFDIFHLVEPGRTKFQKILSDQTIALLKLYGMPPTPSPTPTPSASETPSGLPSASPSSSSSASPGF